MQRAALGAIGWVWLLLAGALLGSRPVLYLPPSPACRRRTPGSNSVSAATGHLLATLGSSGVLAPAAVWALAALTAPWVARGRTLVLDLVRVVIWSALTVSATSAAVVAVHGSDAVGAAPTRHPGGVGRGRRRPWRRAA